MTSFFFHHWHGHVSPAGARRSVVGFATFGTVELLYALSAHSLILLGDALAARVRRADRPSDSGDVARARGASDARASLDDRRTRRRVGSSTRRRA